MGGLAELLFFGLLLWFVFRAAGRASGEVEGGSGEGTEVEGPGRDRGERRRRPPGTPSRSGEPGVRDRLVEELQRWEAEQRARQEQRARWEPVDSRPTEAPVDWKPTEAPIDPRRIEEDLAPPEPASPPSPARRSEERPGPPVSRLPEEAAPGGLRLRRGRGAGLPELARHTALQRAVVLAEILRRPPGLRE